MASEITVYDSTGNPQILSGDDLPNFGIENGSNGNGAWVKYPDGTMICTANKPGGARWTFPQPFTELHAVNVTPVQTDSDISSGVDRVGGYYNATNYGVDVRVGKLDGTSSTVVAYCVAHGRWK